MNEPPINRFVTWVLLLAIFALALGVVAHALLLALGDALGAGRAPIPEQASVTTERSGAGRVERPVIGRSTGATGRSGGMASAYGPGLYGNRLACGGRLWRATHAVAHRSLPCGTPLRVCYRTRCQRLLVRDRGPWVYSRSLDITEAAVRRFGVGSAIAWGVRYVEWGRV